MNYVIKKLKNGDFKVVRKKTSTSYDIPVVYSYKP